MEIKDIIKKVKNKYKFIIYRSIILDSSLVYPPEAFDFADGLEDAVRICEDDYSQNIDLGIVDYIIECDSFTLTIHMKDRKNGLQFPSESLSDRLHEERKG